jgi:hypothetical protein
MMFRFIAFSLPCSTASRGAVVIQAMPCSGSTDLQSHSGSDQPHLMLPVLGRRDEGVPAEHVDMREVERQLLCRASRSATQGWQHVIWLGTARAIGLTSASRITPSWLITKQPGMGNMDCAEFAGGCLV